MWLLYRCFQLPSATPTETCSFVFAVVETTHLYTTFSTLQFPFIGQLFLSLQLHRAMDLSVFLVTRLLSLLIIWLLIVFHTNLAHFIWFLLNILCSLLDFGNSLSNKRKNIFATFVLIYMPNRGLNHLIFLCLFLFFPGVFSGFYLE